MTFHEFRVAGFGLLMLVLAAAPLTGQHGATDGEWRVTGGDGGRTRYAPLDQINRENVGELEIAWTWRSDNYGSRPEFKNETTPIMVGGVLYFTAGDRRIVVAADLQDVFESLRGNQGYFRRRPLDDGVGGDCSPVKYPAHLAGVDGGQGQAPANPIHESYGVVLRCGWDLVRPELT